jgi:hypothetical protein
MGATGGAWASGAVDEKSASMTNRMSWFFNLITSSIEFSDEDDVVVVEFE